MSYRNNRDWSDLFLPEIKRIVGPMLLEESEFEIDANQATDLIVLKARDLRFACRVRRHGYADRYPWEFTIRSRLFSGAKTELAKIVDGWCDYGFYGHADENNRIGRYFVINFDAFRADLIRRKDKIVYEEKSNGGVDSQFVAFDVRSFSPGVIAKSSHEIPPLGVAA